jgi:glutathione S-transferase
MTEKPRTITYFDIRGRVETIRLMLEDLELEYEDRRITTDAQWDKLRPSTPFGTLPIYKDERFEIPQSAAIYRHFGRAYDLYGKGGRERTECDVTAGALEDAINQLWDFFGTTHTEAARAAFAKDSLRITLQQLDRWLIRNGSPAEFWVGEQVSFVDYLAFRYLDEIDAFFRESLAQRREISAFHARFAARPRIAAYIVSGRRPTAFGFTPMGLKLDPRLKATG